MTNDNFVPPPLTGRWMTIKDYLHQWSNVDAMSPAQQGWICPRCHSVYAPFVRKCDDCRPEVRGNATVNVPTITWEITQASSGGHADAWVSDLERRGLAKRAEVMG